MFIEFFSPFLSPPIFVGVGVKKELRFFKEEQVPLPTFDPQIFKYFTVANKIVSCNYGIRFTYLLPVPFG